MYLQIRDGKAKNPNVYFAVFLGVAPAERMVFEYDYASTLKFLNYPLQMMRHSWPEAKGGHQQSKPHQSSIWSKHRIGHCHKYQEIVLHNTKEKIKLSSLILITYMLVEKHIVGLQMAVY